MKTAASPQGRRSDRQGGRTRRPFFGPTAEVQTRPRLARRGDDHLEAEAERLADRVVDRKPIGPVQPGASADAPATQRRPADAAPGDAAPSAEEAIEEVTIAPELDDEAVQARAVAGDEGAAAAGPPDVDEEVQAKLAPPELVGRGPRSTPARAVAGVARAVREAGGGGAPLSGAVRQRMEAAFGADFSGVRIHADAVAARLADALSAQAFTRGRDIFFAAGAFAPDTREGEHLLAHELTHTIQQGAATAAPGERPGDGEAPPPRSADRAAVGAAAASRTAVAAEPSTSGASTAGAGAAGAGAAGAGAAGAGAAGAGTFGAGAPAGMEPPEIDLTLPPAIVVGPAEAIAVIELADLDGRPEEVTARFLDAGPSAMAASHGAFGPAVERAVTAEQRALADDPPVLAATTSGTVANPLPAPLELPTPAAVRIGDAARGIDSSPLEVVSGPTPAPFRANAERDRVLDAQETESPPAAFQQFLADFTDAIRTHDGTIDTNAGPRPTVARAGEAGVTAMGADRASGLEAMVGQRDAHADALRHHPGQALIQPRMVDARFAVEVAPAPFATVDTVEAAAATEYAEAPLPADVRSAADARLAATLTPRLAEARAQALEAAATSDAETNREVGAARAAAATLNAETDSAQRSLVIDNRREVARLQAEGIETAYAYTDTFAQAAATAETAQRTEIDAHVRVEETRAARALDEGEGEAERLEREGERVAADKKTALSSEQTKGSWWERTKSAIKSAVKAVTSAIDAVFTAVRRRVAAVIERAKNAAIGVINAARTWVVDKLDRFRGWLKAQVDTYLADRFPALARRINEGIDAVADNAIRRVNALADAAVERVRALAGALSAALDRILAAFQGALTSVVRVIGAVLQGDFAGALRAVVEGACAIAGVDSATLFEFLERAGEALTAILRDPVGFVRRFFGAVGSGIGSFYKNVTTHLIEGVVGWLTGALSEIKLTGPFEFSAKGIFRIVLELLGITYASVRARVIRRLPAAERVFGAIEQGSALARRLASEGPGALWDDLRERLAGLRESVLGAIRSWLVTSVLKQGIAWLLALTNPASALVKVVKLLYDLVVFLIERYRQIEAFVSAVYGSVAAAASGSFAKVSTSVEAALARVLPVLISLLASVVGLGGIARKVTQVIHSVTRPVHRGLDFVVDRIIAFARRVLAGARAGASAVKTKASQAVQAVLTWWRTRSTFRDRSGESHMLSYQGTKAASTLFVASSKPAPIAAFLRDRHSRAADGGAGYSQADVGEAQRYYEGNVLGAQQRLAAADTGGSSAKQARSLDANRALVAELQKHLDRLGSRWLSRFFDPDDEKDFPPPKLPVMADNRKATALEADYLVRTPRSAGYRYGVKVGSESGRHVGNLHGWPELQGARLTGTGAKYVRMHLLPHKLGGDAVDSNLTPARGDRFNTPFSAAVEQPAITAATRVAATERKPVWYTFDIDYYAESAAPPSATWPPGLRFPATAFPRRLEAAWGFYRSRDSASTQITRGERMGWRSDTPPLPDLESPPPAINAAVPTPTALLHALKQQGPVTAHFVRNVLIPNRPYPSVTALKQTLWLEGDGARAADRRRYVTTVYDAIGNQVTLK